ncbi:MAG: hypothetical protein V4671_09615 [Armatimonadota bacterium]
MPKNPRDPIPSPELPPRPPKPPDAPIPILIIELVNLDLLALEDVVEREGVTIRWNEQPITVTTSMGSRLGDVKSEDAEQVRQRESSQGFVAKLDLTAPQCLVEVV